jgi:hypothetical protein
VKRPRRIAAGKLEMKEFLPPLLGEINEIKQKYLQLAANA